MKPQGPIILKFGGTSVGSVKNILSLSKIIRNCLSQNPVVVVSALSGVTNKLLSLPNLPKDEQNKALSELKSLHLDFASELIKSQEIENAKDYIQKAFLKIDDLLKRGIKTKAHFDNLVSFGEILAAYLVAASLNEQGINSSQVLATELIVTDEKYSEAEFLPEETKINCQKVLLPLINQGVVPVITGFIGATKDGKITTLGRGGSDYSASIIGFCLNATEIQIWTDVDGIFSADPRLIKNARLIETISFREASELAFFGAKVLHPRSVRPAIKANIPVRVLNSFNPKNRGTLIVKNFKDTSKVTAISFKKQVTLVNIYSSEMLLQRGFLSKVFAIFASSNISVDLVSVSEVSVSVTLDNIDGLSQAIEELSKIAQVAVNKEVGTVSLVGEGIVTASNIVKDIFEVLDKNKIRVKMVSLGATDINISLVINYTQIGQAVKLLHKKLLERRNR